MIDQLMRMLEEREEEMIGIRRYLHQNPELSFKEEKTAAYIADFYRGKDVDLITNAGNGYGIVVTIEGGNPGKTVALRADFDALPIKEELDVPFKSKKEGIMHACGHDAHTAYLMVLADCLNQLKDKIHGTVKIIHQHAEEEPPGGAKALLRKDVSMMSMLFLAYMFCRSPLLELLAITADIPSMDAPILNLGCRQAADTVLLRIRPTMLLLQAPIL